MTMTHTMNGSALTVKVSGRLDTTNAPRFETELKELMGDVTALTLDFEEVEYISSAGLRVLLSVQKAMNRQGTMKLVNVQETVQEIFEITGFQDILTIE